MHRLNYADTTKMTGKTVLLGRAFLKDTYKYNTHKTHGAFICGHISWQIRR